MDNRTDQELAWCVFLSNAAAYARWMISPHVRLSWPHIFSDMGNSKEEIDAWFLKRINQNIARANEKEVRPESVCARTESYIADLRATGLYGSAITPIAAMQKETTDA